MGRRLNRVPGVVLISIAAAMWGLDGLIRKPLAQPVVKRRAVARVELFTRDALGWVLGVEVEREPGHLGAEPARDPLGRRLAEPAERSDVVGPDKDGVVAHCSS